MTSIEIISPILFKDYFLKPVYSVYKEKMFYVLSISLFSAK